MLTECKRLSMHCDPLVQKKCWRLMTFQLYITRHTHTHTHKKSIQLSLCQFIDENVKEKQNIITKKLPEVWRRGAWKTRSPRARRLSRLPRFSGFRPAGRFVPSWWRLWGWCSPLSERWTPSRSWAGRTRWCRWRLSDTPGSSLSERVMDVANWKHFSP